MNNNDETEQRVRHILHTYDIPETTETVHSAVQLMQDLVVLLNDYGLDQEMARGVVDCAVLAVNVVVAAERRARTRGLAVGETPTVVRTHFSMASEMVQVVDKP